MSWRHNPLFVVILFLTPFNLFLSLLPTTTTPSHSLIKLGPLLARAQTTRITIDSLDSSKDGAILIYHPPQPEHPLDGKTDGCTDHPEQTKCLNIWYNEPWLRSHVTSGDDVSLEFSFTGSSVEAFGYKSNKGANGLYSIDSGDFRPFTALSSDATDVPTSFLKVEGLDHTKNHKLIMKYDPESNNGQSMRRKWAIDYFIYEQGAPVTSAPPQAPTTAPPAQAPADTNTATSSQPQAPNTNSPSEPLPSSLSTRSAGVAAADEANPTSLATSTGITSASGTPPLESSSADVLSTSGVNVPAVVGATVGGVVASMIIIGSFVFFLQRRRKKVQGNNQSGYNSSNPFLDFSQQPQTVQSSPAVMSSHWTPPPIDSSRYDPGSEYSAPLTQSSHMSPVSSPRTLMHGVGSHEDGRQRPDSVEWRMRESEPPPGYAASDSNAPAAWTLL